jgi:hypothetical protein
MRRALMLEITPESTSQEPDSVSWALENSCIFSSHSPYQKMHQGATVAHAKDICKISAPLKVRIFLWQLAKDHLSAAQQIRKRHGPSNGNCVLCAQPNDVSQFFFNCPLAQFLWSGVRSMFGVSWNSTSFADTFAIFHCFNGRTRKLLWILFAAQIWALWLIRNKATIEAKFPT